MAPKKQRIGERGESFSTGGSYETRIFVSAAAQQRYKALSSKIVITA